MRYLNFIISFILFLCLFLIIGFLTFNIHALRQDFSSHYHFSPKQYSIELTEKKLSENIPYYLTKPKPKWQQSSSGGYVFWSSCYKR